MALFRKKETYNEQMLREAGLDRVVFNTPQSAAGDARATEPEPEPASATPGWDVLTRVLAQVHGHRVDFMTLPDGDIIVTAGPNDDDLAPFADAVEEHISAPYKASAARQDGNVWEVGATRIEVEQFAFDGADSLELSQTGGVTELHADGAPSSAAAPAELQRVGERAGADFSVVADRIDGDYWEVRANPL